MQLLNKNKNKNDITKYITDLNYKQISNLKNNIIIQNEGNDYSISSAKYLI